MTKQDFIIGKIYKWIYEKEDSIGEIFQFAGINPNTGTPMFIPLGEAVGKYDRYGGDTIYKDCIGFFISWKEMELL